MYRVQSQTQQIHAVEGYPFDATNVAHSGVPAHQSRQMKKKAAVYTSNDLVQACTQEATFIRKWLQFRIRIH